VPAGGVLAWVIALRFGDTEGWRFLFGARRCGHRIPAAPRRDGQPSGPARAGARTGHTVMPVAPP
jgi:hypothetical protein